MVGYYNIVRSLLCNLSFVNVSCLLGCRHLAQSLRVRLTHLAHAAASLARQLRGRAGPHVVQLCIGWPPLAGVKVRHFPYISVYIFVCLQLYLFVCALGCYSIVTLLLVLGSLL